MSILPENRHTVKNPCRVCSGFDEAPRGSDNRCFGFDSPDGEWIHCTRPEFASGIRMNPESQSYAHRGHGLCICGREHNPSHPIVHPPKNGVAQNKARITATYNYSATDGRLLYQVVRFEPKSFKQRRSDGKGGWIWNLKGVSRVLYRLPELIAADPTAIVFIVEGEKDVDRLRSLGFVATTNAQGALKWNTVESHAREILKGRRVVILPDNDDTGRRHAQQVAQSLYGYAASIKVLKLAGLPEKGDMSDWLDQGGQHESIA